MSRYALLPASLVSTAYSIEHASYPEDEEASLEALTYRQANAGEHFLAAFASEPETNTNNSTCTNIQGYICSSLTKSFDHDSLSVHDPNGDILAIHSVCVDEKYRRKRIAYNMLRHYISEAATHNNIKTIKLMAKEHLVDFYVGAGFTCYGLSPILHGADRWFDLSLDLVDYRRPTFIVVDAFANQAGMGNPACVVQLQPKLPKSQTWKQVVAKEFNLSETVYITKQADELYCYDIAYYTPIIEVLLCGHATLASASVLFQTGEVAKDQTITFITANKVRLNATFIFETEQIELVFPANMPTLYPNPEPVHTVIESAFKIRTDDIKYTGFTKYIKADGSEGIEDVLVEVTQQAFENVQDINLSTLSTTSAFDCGVILTCKGGGPTGSSFQSRFFAPKAGINEDPVCGRAHCILAPYYQSQVGDLAALPLRGFQNSGRSGVVDCFVEGGDKVILRGNFVHVSEGRVLMAD